MSIIDWLRRPEYTGENRCTPCTGVNVALAAGAAGLLALLSPYLAVAVLAVSLATIYLRGYLVPGTPSLTKRYMPNWMVRWFGKSPDLSPGGTHTDVNTSQPDIEQVLRDADAVELCSNSNDLCLTDSFQRRWDDAIQSLDGYLEPVDAIEAFGVNGTNIDIDQHGDTMVIRSAGTIIGQWPSEIAFLVDIAGSQVLSSLVPNWQRYPPHERIHILAGLRIFLEKCPDGSTVEFQEGTVESCCSSYEVVSAICSETSDRLFEQPVNN